MKKNKTVAFMLAATLMVGGTFLGTKAWFTDSDTASNDLVISMGSLDVDVTNERPNGILETQEDIEGWYLIKNGIEDANNLIEDVDLSNLKPGDKLVRKIKIENTGTLKQEIDVNTSSNCKSISDMQTEFKKYGFTFKCDQDIFALKSLGTSDNDKSQEYNLVLEVENSKEDNASNTTEVEKVNLNSIIGTITVNATQYDAK